MKKFALILMAGLSLTACGNAGQMLGNRVSVGVDAGDTKSVEVATRVVTPATPTAPATETWTIKPGSGVTFTFTARPGSDAVYIEGFKVTRQEITAGGTTRDTADNTEVRKMNLYVPSGYTCAVRSALRSCDYGAADAVPANGVPVQTNIYLEGGLGSLVQATGGSVYQVTDLEFFGVSSNGAPVTIKVGGVVSSGELQGAS